MYLGVNKFPAAMQNMPFIRSPEPLPAAHSLKRKEFLKLIREYLIKKINDACEPAGINFTVTYFSPELI
jgi:hypothetical protein